MPDILEVEINGRLPVHPADGGPLVAHIGRMNVNRMNGETIDQFRERVLGIAETNGAPVVVWSLAGASETAEMTARIRHLSAVGGSSLPSGG